MISRMQLKSLERALKREAAVALNGPRQVGKTTLAHQIAETRPSIYIDLEFDADRQKLANPVEFLNYHQDKLVIIDEIHRAPHLFEALRGLIDKGRRNGNDTGRFLLLGSASIELMRQSETLAGRISYVELTPINPLEVGEQVELRELWVRGGYPRNLLADDENTSFQRRLDLVRTYLERDIPMFRSRVPVETLSRLWTMLGHNQGSLLNISKLAGSLGYSSPSVASYTDLFTDLLLLRRLQPYYCNVRKRLSKSPKTYVRDSGLLHVLLGIRSYEELLGHPVVGMSWEGFVIESVLSVAPREVKPYFYRTAAGSEIDLLLDFGGSKGIWAIEIKLGLAAKTTKGFAHALEDVQPNRAYVAYSGEERYPKSRELEVIGLTELCWEVASAFA